jgi:hypothetical protein
VAVVAQTWVNKLVAAEKCGNKLEAEIARARVVLYDSLQVCAGAACDGPRSRDDAEL